MLAGRALGRGHGGAMVTASVAGIPGGRVRPRRGGNGGVLAQPPGPGMTTLTLRLLALLDEQAGARSQAEGGRLAARPILSNEFATCPGAMVTSCRGGDGSSAAAAPIWATGEPPASATPG